MKVTEVCDALHEMVLRGFGDCELECSVDVSVEGDESTYADRVFGSGPYTVRLFEDLVGRNVVERKVQILFVNGSDNRRK